VRSMHSKDGRLMERQFFSSKKNVFSEFLFSNYSEFRCGGVVNKCRGVTNGSYLRRRHTTHTASHTRARLFQRAHARNHLRVDGSGRAVRWILFVVSIFCQKAIVGRHHLENQEFRSELRL
jgi:hypothetical protein